MAQRVTIQIIADASQAQGVVDAINKSLGNIGGTAFKQVTQNVNQLSDAMIKAVQISNSFVQAGYRLTVGLSAPIIAAATYVTKLGAELESARASFEVFTGSIVQATQHLEDLKTLATSSPLDFTQILSLSRYLQAAGIEASRVVPLLKSVGNALIVSGDPGSIERIIQQLVRIQNLGRVTLRELNPLARAGIPVFAELADAIRKPGEEADKTAIRLRNLLKSGNLPGPEFLNYFQAIQKVRFPEGLEKAAATLKGQFQELKNAIEIAAGNLGEALAPAALLLVKVFTEVVKVLNSVAITFQQLPTFIKIIIGGFVALAAVIGPLILAFGYVSRALLSTYNLFNLVTGSVNKNTIASTENVVASNAVASAKVKEAAATELVAKAVQSETKAKAAHILANDSSLLKQLPLIFSDPRRNSLGRFAKGPPALPYSAPPQLGLFDNLATSESKLVGIGAADDVIASAATTSRVLSLTTALGKFAGIAGIIIVAADGIYKGFKAIGDLGPKLTGLNAELDSIGISFSNLSSIAKNSITLVIENLDKLSTTVLGTKDGAVSKGINTIGDAFSLAVNPTNLFSLTVRKVGEQIEQLTKDIEDFKNKNPNFNLTKNLANLPAGVIAAFPSLGVLSAGAQKTLSDRQKEAALKAANEARDKNINQASADAAAEALRNKIKLNEAEEIYAKNLQLTEQGQRQSREFAIVAEGKELGGLQLVNKELDKYIDKLRTHIEKIPGTDLTEERVRGLSNIEQLNIFRALVADTANEIKKTQKEVADAGYKVDEESYKLRISALDQYTKDRVSKIEALGVIEEASVSEITRRTTAIQSTAARDRALLEIGELNKAFEKRSQELDKLQTSLNAPDNIAQRAKALTDKNPNVRPEQIIALELAARQTAQNQINAQRDFAEKDNANKLIADKNVLNSTLYNLDLEYVNKENALFRDANEQHERATAEASQSILNFQKQAVEQSKQVQLTNLQFQQPVSLKETLALNTEVLNINQESVKQQTNIAIEESISRNTELRRIEVQSLNNRFEDNENGQRLKAQALSDFDKKAVEEQVEIYSKGYDEIGNNVRQSALQQFQAIKENALNVFESIKSASRGLLDELFDPHKTKTFGQIIGDTIKSAISSAAKNLISSQISAAYTQLVTGQSVTLKSPQAGPLGFLFGNKPVIGNNGAPTTIGGLTVEQISVLSASLKQANAEAIKATPVKLQIPTEPIPVAIPFLDVFKAAAEKYGKEGISEVKINDSIPVKVIITGYESAAAAEQAAFKAALSKGLIPQSEIDRQSPEEQERLNSANAAIIKSRTLQFPIPGALGKDYNISSPYGNRDNPNARGQVQFHQGIDIATIPGTPVIASLAGTVEKLNEDFKTLGNSVRLRNEDTGISTLYGHLIKAPDLTVGQKVDQGTVLGGVGATGNALGPNLHFGVYNPQGQSVDPNQALNNPSKSIDTIFENINDYAAAKFKALTSSPSAFSTITHTPIYYQKKTDSTAGQYNKIGNNIDLFLDDTHTLGSADTKRAILHEETHAAIEQVRIPGAVPDTYSTAQYNAINKFVPEAYRNTAYNALNNVTAGGYSNPLDAAREVVPRLVSGEGFTLGLTKDQSDESINKIITGLKSTNDPIFAKLSDILDKINTSGTNLIDKDSFGYSYYQNAGKRPYKPNKDIFDSLLSSKDIDTNTYQTIPQTAFPDAVASTGTISTAIPTSTGGGGSGFNVASLLPGGTAGAAGGIILGAAVGAAAGTTEHFTKSSEIQRAIKSAYGVNVDPNYAQAIYNNIIGPKYQGNIQAGLRDSQVISMVSAYSASGQGRSGFGTAAKSFFTQGGALATGAASLPLLQQTSAGNVFSGGSGTTNISGGGFNFGGITSAISGLGINPQVSSGVNQIFKQLGSNITAQQQAYNRQQVSSQGFTKTLTNFLKTGKFTSQDNTVGAGIGNIPQGYEGDVLQPLGGLPDINSLNIAQLPLGSPQGYGLGDASTLAQLPLGAPAGYGIGDAANINDLPISGGPLEGLASQLPSDATNYVGGLSGALNSTNSALSGILSGPGGKAISGLTTGLGLGLFSAGLSQKAGTGVGAAALTTAGGASAGFGLSKQLGLSPLVGLGAGAGIGLFSSGIKRGGAVGIAEDVGGGALTGASIGAQFGGPVGAGIGAVVGAAAGAVAGVARLFIKGAAEKVQSEVKTLYNVSISRQYAQSIYDTIIKPKYGGNIQAGIRSKDVLDMLALYSSSTGQKFGIVNKARPLQLIQTGTGLTQAANYQNNQALSFANLGVYGGVQTQTILSPQHLSTGGLAPYQQLPGQGDAAAFNLVPGTSAPLPSPTGGSNGSNSAPAPGPTIIENKLPSDQVGNYFDGRTVRTIINSPSAVASSVTSAYGSNVGRRSSANLLVSPSELLT